MKGGDTMEDMALSIAKEITLAALTKMEMGPNKGAEVVGDQAGKLFKTVLKQVREGILENPPESKPLAIQRQSRS
jgi:hypothetical protein